MEDVHISLRKNGQRSGGKIKMPCKKCGDELLLDQEIASGKCLACMMIEFQESQREEGEHGD